MSRPSPAPMPPDVTTQTQYVREAPEIEARKLGLMDTASQLAQTGLTIPTQQVAGFQPTQTQAFQRQQAGLGTFEPRKPKLSNLEKYEDNGVDYIIRDPEKYRDKKILSLAQDHEFL